MYSYEPNDRVSGKFQAKPEEGCNGVQSGSSCEPDRIFYSEI